MGDSLRMFNSSKNMEPGNEATKKFSYGCLISSTRKNFSHGTSRCIISMKQSVRGSGSVGDIGVFLLTTLALEAVRRISKARCPFIWRGLQALQIFCYPPLNWIQKWAPFNGLFGHMQSLSRPMLVLSIATTLSDQSACSNETSSGISDFQSFTGSACQPASELSTPERRSCDNVTRGFTFENWLTELRKELEKQGINIPERFNESELYRFYAAANGEFPKLISSIKKTIHWRQTYTLFSPQELEAWSHLVFWHGCDVKLQPSLIIRLGLACSNLRSIHRPHFVKAVVSQIEHGIASLVDKEDRQITVLMDCHGLSPFGFPVQMMRSCATLLQDHYPNCLGCLIVIRLAPVSRVITRTLFQVLNPSTRQKVRILGDDYHKVLSECLQKLPSFLGGKCFCPKCSDFFGARDANEEIIQSKPSADLTNKENGPSSNVYYTDSSMNVEREQVIRTAIISVIMFWIFIAFIFAMHYPDALLTWYRDTSS